MTKQFTITLFSILSLLFLVITPLATMAQSTINGEVKNQKGEAASFASVSIQGTVDGTTTGVDGKFSFTTNLKGPQTLMVNLIGYNKAFQSINLADTVYTVTIQLQASARQLEEVTITAGTIEANNDRSVAVLKPLDIVTTAGAQADVIGAIQTLPGVQRNGGDQTGLMVRGGDVSESSVIVDGTITQNAFNSSVPGVAQRSRLNPFSFKGTAFSSGGYTVRYGQALSAILDLQTTDLPEKNNMNIGVNFAGGYVSGSKLMGKNAVEYAANYTNIAPYLAIANTNVDFYDVPQGGGISARYVSRTENNGIFKMNLTHAFNKSGITIPDPTTAGASLNFGIKNENTLLTTSYKYFINEHVKLFSAFSYSNNTDNVSWGAEPLYRNDDRLQGRLELWFETKERKLNVLIGSDVQRYNFTQRFDTLIGQFSELMSAGYVEAEWKPILWFAIKPGVRGEYSQFLGRGNIVPRAAFAIRTGEASQVSAATGMFYQAASTNYLLQGYRPDFQQSIHYMLNYQWMKKDRTLRVEGYYKSYDQLVRENGTVYTPNQFRFDFGTVDNSGSGYAQGIDFFWRDRKSIKNFDYWISYSYVDTKRLYQNYVDKVTPDYVSDHNLNVIAKYFIMKWQTNISATYSYASGRPYYDPNSTEFLSGKAPDFHNFSVTISYLTTIRRMFTVFYLSLDNVTNQKNVLGYRYSADGTQRFPIIPPMYRSIFLGVNFSLTEFNKDEL
ncbi:MAG: TonB-dependent receptor [Fluviicola sp.]|nr:TonB-dependent receptor [Fluviicola sp.]